ncbi:TatD family hydrolase [Georgenia sp. EYE_87]|uniref:Qat anti-phage system TatD family nuclease QatD n=1 Tax=Georgenia sp. EYE_87 TaxID=2853448 RepID=UPI0020056B4A|nr:Qat anti-phage system TatD family nuclease QatD [Georgenia sp. EYE_87]MCK6210520.1 TatD family hydrolase [Georgenia sp. EYE_87]
MIDFHCHLDLYPNPVAVADELERRGVGVLSVTTTPAAWAGTTRLAKGRPLIRTALGLHPELAGARYRELHLFDRLLPETRFVGEVGLDGSPRHLSSWDSQIQVFDHVLRSCEQAGGKVLSVHSRLAASQVLGCLDRYPGLDKVVLHWFSGTKAEVRRAAERGCWFSVGPAMLTGARGRSLVSEIPTDRLVVETDGPFAQKNRRPLRPWDVTDAIDGLADLWGSTRQHAAQVVRANESALLSL